MSSTFLLRIKNRLNQIASEQKWPAHACSKRDRSKWCSAFAAHMNTVPLRYHQLVQDEVFAWLTPDYVKQLRLPLGQERAWVEQQFRARKHCEPVSAPVQSHHTDHTREESMRVQPMRLEEPADDSDNDDDSGIDPIQLLQQTRVTFGQNGGGPQYTCRRCKSHNVTMTEKQTRAGDEDTSFIFQCADCDASWK